MGRPKRHRAEKRSERYNLRFTIAEIEHIRQQADAVRLPIWDYLRRRCVGHQVSPSPTRQFDPAVVTELNQLGLQLAKLGNVANQVALYLHTERRLPPEWELLPAEIKQTQRRVAEVLDQLVLSDD